ncbi:MAG: META domain-containing protein [Treponema sp.]|jgi:heat shock protein HslJ|nr:META domain-containing protein [Treponema sp.]
MTKKNSLFFGVCALAAALCVCLAAACASAGAAFEPALNTDWFLAQIESDGAIITFNRGELADEGFAGAFSIRFAEGRAAGLGAPNRYTGPYTVKGASLSIGQPAATKMLALRQPEGLTENAYFAFLARTTGWRLADGRLFLDTRTEEGGAASLVFARASD